MIELHFILTKVVYSRQPVVTPETEKGQGRGKRLLKGSDKILNMLTFLSGNVEGQI